MISSAVRAAAVLVVSLQHVTPCTKQAVALGPCSLQRGTHAQQPHGTMLATCLRECCWESLARLQLVGDFMWRWLGSEPEGRVVHACSTLDPLQEEACRHRLPTLGEPAPQTGRLRWQLTHLALLVCT